LRSQEHKLRAAEAKAKQQAESQECAVCRDAVKDCV
jgi:hypothetical protein